MILYRKLLRYYLMYEDSGKEFREIMDWHVEHDNEESLYKELEQKYKNIPYIRIMAKQKFERWN